MRRLGALVVSALAFAGVLVTAPSAPAAAGLSVSSVGSSVMALHLDRPVTLGEQGLSVSFGPVPTWGAVVIARQSPGVGTLVGTTWTGTGLVSDGRRPQTVPLGGASSLPAGSYALYVLAPVGYRLSATVALPGVPASALATWSRRQVSVTTRHSSLVASIAALSDRVPVTAKTGAAVVMMGATSGTPIAHDLAACLVEGVPPTGAESECGTSQLTTYRESSHVGYGDSTLAVSVPRMPAGSYTGVLRGEATGLGSGITFTTLQWAWTAPRRTAVA